MFLLGFFDYVCSVFNFFILFPRNKCILILKAKLLNYISLLIITLDLEKVHLYPTLTEILAIVYLLY